MSRLDDLKPSMAMCGLQFSYAGVALLTRAALLGGMSPVVFVVYRQAIATCAVAPIAFFRRRGKSHQSSLGLRSATLIFLTSLIGVTINQNIYFEGLYLASSSMASAMGNLIPAVTFVLATIIGLEKVKLGSLRSIAKVAGTILCVVGATSMALLRGPKLLNLEEPIELAKSGGSNWLIGCLLLFGSCCCWSCWLILQVPVTASYPDHLSLSAWMCFSATLQSAIIALFLEPDPEAWIIHSKYELLCCLFAGIIGSGLSFFVQAWCISRRGPLFSAMFSPLATVIVTILASLFLHEQIYTGSLVGALGVIIGLYVVLWGKAKDLEEMTAETYLKTSEQDDQKNSFNIDVEQPLLDHDEPSSDQDKITETSNLNSN